MAAKITYLVNAYTLSRGETFYVQAPTLTEAIAGALDYLDTHLEIKEKALTVFTIKPTDIPPIIN